MMSTKIRPLAKLCFTERRFHQKPWYFPTLATPLDKSIIMLVFTNVLEIQDMRLQKVLQLVSASKPRDCFGKSRLLFYQRLVQKMCTVWSLSFVYLLIYATR